MPRFVVSVVWGAILSAFIFLLSAFIFLLSFSYAELKSIKMQRDSFLNGHLATQSQRSYHSQSLLPQISLCFDLPSSRCFAVQRRCAATEQKCTLGCEKGAIATLHIQSVMSTIVTWKFCNAARSQASKCLLQAVATGVPS